MLPLARALAFGLLAVFLLAAPASSQSMRVTLLGTGTPRPDPERSGPATLVEAGDTKLLIDVGRGTTTRLGETGLGPADISAVLVTHMHSDHLTGLVDLWLLGYLPPWYRDRALPVYGPPGTRDLAAGLEAAFRTETDGREAGSRPGPRIDPVEIDHQGPVFEQGGVTVTAIAVDHIPNSYAFRVDYQGRSVVVSGDTSPSDNLVRHAQGVDLLVHEVMAISDGVLDANPQAAPAMRRVLSIHTTPEQAAGVARRASPRMLVFNHVSLNGVTEAEVVAAVRSAYAGPVAVGRDLMTILVGEEVRIED